MEGASLGTTRALVGMRSRYQLPAGIAVQVSRFDGSAQDLDQAVRSGCVEWRRGLVSRRASDVTATCSSRWGRFDPRFHPRPPYTADTTSDDMYFQCVDLVLTASAPPADAGAAPDAGDGGSGNGPGGASGGCSTSGGAPGLLLVAELGVLRRRRARR